MRAIIPAAGLGTRMNMPKDKSKEMLLVNGIPMIDHTIELCEKYGINPYIVTRAEKQDLIHHCKHRCPIHIIEPKAEWPQTVLETSDKWWDNNVLLLPDVIFAPGDILLKIKTALELGSSAAFGVHAVNDISKWGSLKDNYLTEKSKLTIPGMAWGVLGFKKYYGQYLFKNMLHQDTPFRLHDVSYIPMEFFKDITK